MSWPPELDELYSISDLHLGGQEGFQIFDQGERLAAFLGWLTGRPKDRRVALVIGNDAYANVAALFKALNTRPA